MIKKVEKESFQTCELNDSYKPKSLNDFNKETYKSLEFVGFDNELCKPKSINTEDLLSNIDKFQEQIESLKKLNYRVGLLKLFQESVRENT